MRPLFSIATCSTHFCLNEDIEASSARTCVYKWRKIIYTFSVKCNYVNHQHGSLLRGHVNNLTIYSMSLSVRYQESASERARLCTGHVCWHYRTHTANETNSTWQRGMGAMSKRRLWCDSSQRIQHNIHNQLVENQSLFVSASIFSMLENHPKVGDTLGCDALNVWTGGCGERKHTLGQCG